MTKAVTPADLHTHRDMDPVLDTMRALADPVRWQMLCRIAELPEIGVARARAGVPAVEVDAVLPRAPAPRGAAGHRTQGRAAPVRPSAGAGAGGRGRRGPGAAAVRGPAPARAQRVAAVSRRGAPPVRRSRYRRGLARCPRGSARRSARCRAAPARRAPREHRLRAAAGPSRAVVEQPAPTRARAGHERDVRRRGGQQRRRRQTRTHASSTGVDHSHECHRWPPVTALSHRRRRRPRRRAAGGALRPRSPTARTPAPRSARRRGRPCAAAPPTPPRRRARGPAAALVPRDPASPRACPGRSAPSVAVRLAVRAREQPQRPRVRPRRPARAVRHGGLGWDGWRAAPPRAAPRRGARPARSRRRRLPGRRARPG